jgi:hypothetical protein
MYTYLYSSKANTIMEIARLLPILFCQVHDEGLVIVVIVKVVLEERSWISPLLFYLIKKEVSSYIIFVISSALVSCPWLIGNNFVLFVVVLTGHLVSNNFPSIDNVGCCHLVPCLGHPLCHLRS